MMPYFQIAIAQSNLRMPDGRGYGLPSCFARIFIVDFQGAVL
jgi:hypothetical protein